MHDETSDDRAAAPSSESDAAGAARDPASSASGSTSTSAPSPAGPPSTAGTASRRGDPRRITLSTTLLAANVAVFIAMLISGVGLFGPTTKQVLAWGANSGVRVAEGQWWRLLTAAFVHIGVLHLGVNMLALRSLAVVERLFGSAGFAFIYFASALGASVTSILWHPANVSAGASGALFGLLGALLAFFLAHRRIMPNAISRPMILNLLVTIGINVVFGLSVAFIDNGAHFGGLATGFAAGLCLNRELVPGGPGSPAMFVAKPSRKPLARSILLGLVILAAAAFIPARVRSDPRVSVVLLLGEASESIEAGDYTAAEAACDRAIASNPESAEAHYLRARCRNQLNDVEGAVSDLDRALDLSPDLVEARDVRWRLRRYVGDTEGELRDLDRLVDLLPDEAIVYRERGNALYAAGRWKEALRDFQKMAGREHDGDGEAQVYSWLASARLGLRDSATQELKHYLASFQAGSMSRDWRRIALVLVGESDRASLDALANGVEGEPDSSCRARFFAASLALLDHGDAAAAARDLEKCGEVCDGSSAEYWSARAELDRLGK
jgi:membrane associated rhomboid family serine protease/tetratricopeptide (TPR) repeat protein